jgi:hypothetical protein
MNICRVELPVAYAGTAAIQINAGFPSTGEQMSDGWPLFNSPEK